MDERAAREAVVAAYRRLDADGLNRAASGNVSMRLGAHMLVTPSGVPADEMRPEQVARLRVEDDGGAWDGPCRPSSEWRFHRAILHGRLDLGAVVHTHAPFSTILSILRRPIPAVHYMIAAFGAAEIRVADYALYGTDALSRAVLAAMEGRAGCLMANHGMVVAGPDMGRALWLAGELETLAHQFYHASLMGPPHVLSNAEVADAMEAFKGYGPGAKP